MEEEEKEIKEKSSIRINSNDNRVVNSLDRTDEIEGEGNEDTESTSPSGIKLNPFNPSQTHSQLLDQVTENMYTTKRYFKNLADYKFEIKEDNDYNENIGVMNDSSHKNDELRESEGEQLVNNNFVTQKELEFLEEKIDLKITNAVQPLEGKLETLTQKIDSKFETLDSNLKLMFYEQESKLREQRNTNIKWTIGIVITALGIVLPIALNLIGQ